MCLCVCLCGVTSSSVGLCCRDTHGLLEPRHPLWRPERHVTLISVSPGDCTYTHLCFSLYKIYVPVVMGLPPTADASIPPSCHQPFIHKDANMHPKPSWLPLHWRFLSFVCISWCGSCDSRRNSAFLLRQSHWEIMLVDPFFSKTIVQLSFYNPNNRQRTAVLWIIIPMRTFCSCSSKNERIQEAITSDRKPVERIMLVSWMLFTDTNG